MLVTKEKQGKPMFVTMDVPDKDVQMNKA